jgi:hypothetical protein
MATHAGYQWATSSRQKTSRHAASYSSQVGRWKQHALFSSAANAYGTSTVLHLLKQLSTEASAAASATQLSRASVQQQQQQQLTVGSGPTKDNNPLLLQLA